MNSKSQSFDQSLLYNELEMTGQLNQIGLFDYDEDGDDDVFCYGSTNDSRILVYQNNNGKFDSSFVFYNSASRTMDLAFFDYDSDLDIDIVATRFATGDIIKFENLNNGNFSVSIQSNIVPGLNEHIDNADMDNDGNIDLVYASYAPHHIRWIKNLGSGVFSSTWDTVAVLNDRIRSFELADLDNDGDIDAITQYKSVTYSTSAMSINDGSGNFTTSNNFPIPAYSFNWGYTLGDFNNDSLIDIAYVISNSVTKQVKILWNDTANGFSTSSIIRNHLNSDVSPITLEKFDFDGDNDLDLLIGETTYQSNPHGVVLVNQGSGTFLQHSDVINAASWGALYNGNSYRGIEMFFSDFDTDGNIDVLSNSYLDKDLIVHYQDNNAKFSNSKYLNHSFTGIHSFQTIDYNNDSHMDLITSDERQFGKIEISYGNGSGKFDSTQVITDNKTAYGAIGSQVAYWNNNTNNDLIFSSSNKIYVHLDYETPNDTILLLFTSSTSSPLGNIGYTNIINKVFTIADIDNDGDNDLMVPQFGTSPYYWVENTGTSSTARLAFSQLFERYLLVDFDGDLDQDFIGQRYNSTLNLTEYLFYRMDHNLKLFVSDTIMKTPNLGAHQFASGDIDNDNDEDIIISGLLWMENRGQGNYLAPDTLILGYTTLSNIVVDDIDNDGFLDIITNVTRQGPTRQLITPLFNQDSNIFIPLAQELQVSVSNQHAIATADFDGNGFKSIVANTFTNLGTAPVIFDFCIHSEDTFNLNLCYGDSYTYADGTFRNNIQLNESYISTLTGQASNGCDSIVTEFLNVLPEIDDSLSINGFTINAINSSATYQWLNCNSNYSQISGETAQSYTATANGSYAVELTEGSCKDTSACALISTVGLSDSEANSVYSISPNPSNGSFMIAFEKESSGDLSIFTLEGQKVYQSNIHHQQSIRLELNLVDGLYILVFSTDQGVFKQSLILNK